MALSRSRIKKIFTPENLTNSTLIDLELASNLLYTVNVQTFTEEDEIGMTDTVYLAATLVMVNNKPVTKSNGTYGFSYIYHVPNYVGGKHTKTPTPSELQIEGLASEFFYSAESPRDTQRIPRIKIV